MSWSHRAWRCPFFVCDGKLRISCECGKVKFDAPMEKTAFADEFCGKHDSGGCSLAAARTAWILREEHDHEKC